MAAQSEEFERAWAQIVADLTADGQTLFDVAGTDADEAAGSTGKTDSTDALPDQSAASPADATMAETPTPAPVESQPIPRAAEPGPPATDPGAFVEGWEDEGHFTPPQPPDLPTGSPATRLGWAGALGGIATMVLVTLTGWNGPRIVMWAAGLATIAGFVTLVWQLPDSHGDGWDDGAQL